jgi:hypothetical protein
VLAFAGPDFITSKDDGKGQPLSFIYIDNSFSMMAEGENGRLFDEAVEVARQLVNSSIRETRFVLINNQSKAARLQNKDAVQSEIDQVTISPANKNLSSVLRNAQRFASAKDFSNFEMYLLSDFQKNSFDVDDFPEDSTGEYLFIPFSHLQKRNIFIDSCWMEEPVVMQGKLVKLIIRIQNSSHEDLEKVPLKLSINGNQKAVAGVDIPGKSFKDIRVSVRPGKSGWQLGIIAIEDYPVTFDDQYFFSFFVSHRIKVLEIYDQEPSVVLREFYNSDSIFEFSSVNSRQVNYNSLNEYRMIILNSLSALSSGLIKQIADYANKGGNVLFVPQTEGTFENENIFLNVFGAGSIARFDTSRTRVASIKNKHKLFSEAIIEIPDNADLPIIFSHVKYNYHLSSGLESLVSLLNGDDFLLTKEMGSGQLFLLASPLQRDFGNFTTQALFVPVMYGIAIQQRIQQEMAYTLGLDDRLETDITSAIQSETPFILKDLTTAYSFIPEQKLTGGKLIINTHEGIPTAGFYHLQLNDVDYDVFSFNFNRNESVMEFIDPDDLEAEIEATGLANFKIIEPVGGDYSKVAEAVQKEHELWKLFIIFALLILLAEVLILRFWK